MNACRLAPLCKALLTAAILLLLGSVTGGTARAQAEEPAQAPAARIAATELLTDIQAVTVGDNHSCALADGGGVQCWGANGSGQLGDGTQDERLVPVDVFGLTSGVQKISAGAAHTCALTDGGGVKCWGANNAGQLGDGTTTDRLKPADVSGLTSGVQKISAGAAHTCALTSGGGVKCWGANNAGQLGDGTTTDRYTPVDVTGLTSGVQAVTVRGSYTCALTTGGGAKCWGDNSQGQLGDGTKTNRTAPVDVTSLTSGVQAVAAGAAHTCALTSSGGVKCWGLNGSGQLGDGTTADRPTPVDVSGLTSGVQAVAVGAYYTCALSTGGGVKCWGENTFGQLGDGTTTRRLAPVAVSGLGSGVQSVAAGSSHTCALTTGGVKCWGANQYGQLGSGTTNVRVIAVDVGGLTGVGAIAAGGYHNCALAGGGLRCWGSNDYGQLGDGTTDGRYTPADVTGLTSGVEAVTGGVYHTCALTTGGGVKCWGYNGYGQVGNGTTDDRLAPTDVLSLTSGIQAVAAGGYHNCALTGGGLRCWGSNDYGQLGDNTTTTRLAPVDVTGLTRDVQTVAAGERHTCAVTTGGGVRCWGSNDYGQLGDNTTTPRLTPVDVTGLTSGVQAVAGGGNHTCALTSGGGVKCWGDNTYGQLGDGTTTERHTPVDVSNLTSGVQRITANAFYTCALLTSGGVKCWGRNNFGQLGDGTQTAHNKPADVVGLVSGVQAVAAGREHACALLTSGGVKCWGSNGDGQLGLNPGWTPLDVVAPQPLIAPQITSTPVTTATVGQPYTYTVTATGAPTPTFSLPSGPVSMTIGANSGLIRWTPVVAGHYTVTVRVTNGVEPAALQTFTITVSGAAQAAAQITSTPVTLAVANQPYTYTVTATGTPKPTFSLSTAPQGMTIDPISGIIRWTPGAPGEYVVTVRAENGVGPAAQQTFTLYVTSEPVDQGKKLYLPLINK